MSADNYLLVRKEDAQWVGYMQCASIEEVSYEEPLFCTDALEDAIILAQEQNTEYGYRFEEGGLYQYTSHNPVPNTSNKNYYPTQCKCCGGVKVI